MNNTVVNKKLLHEIVHNYPITYEWMKVQANLKQMCIGKILNLYRERVNQFMKIESM
jgi:predicted XRE-type DNA-binding protein